jgi:serine hydrolase
MKRVIIVHGYGGHPNKNWFPWLQSALETSGVEVLVPHMPNAQSPQLQEWLPYLQQIVNKPDSETYLIGHSLGCITILKYLESLEDTIQIGGAILVAGFAEPIALEKLHNFFVSELDDTKIHKVAKNIVIINSDTDEYVPLWQGKRMAERFDGKLIVLKNAGHINVAAGFTELPVVLTELDQMFAE